MEDIQKLADYLQYWIALVPLEGWYVFGSLIASAAVLIGTITYQKRRYWKQNAEKLAGWIVTLNVNFWGIVLAVAGFVIANGTNLANLIPFVANHGPQIAFIATSAWAISKPLKAYWLERQKKKDLLSPQLLETIEAAAADIPEPLPTRKPDPVTSDLWSEK